jgi:hypothetical protein
MNTTPIDRDREAELDSVPRRPEIVASFSGYTPPFDAVPIVERMLASVPPKYLIGLKKVVLTNSSGLPRRLRRAVTKARKRKVRIVEARGLYHPEWHGNLAWIEIFVDNTLKRWEKGWWLKFNFWREAKIADVLFHEIGHHIHFTRRPEHREKEDVADIWLVKLRKNYLRGRRPVLRAIFFPLRPLIRFLRKAIGGRMLKRGAISRAEFDEDFKER